MGGQPLAQAGCLLTREVSIFLPEEAEVSNLWQGPNGPAEKTTSPGAGASGLGDDNREKPPRLYTGDRKMNLWRQDYNQLGTVKN